jgi:tetratricopeptide (TPR) repeat protein
MVLGLLWTTLSTSTLAAGPKPLSEFDRSVERLKTAAYPSQIGALRRIWSQWDRVDPTRVEQLLEQARKSPKLAPQAQAYAGLLAAFARTRRGDFVDAQRRIHALGYVDEWLIVGPFDNEGKTGITHDFAPELEFAEPIVFGHAYQGKERPVRWRSVNKAAFPYGWVDLGSLLRPQKKICAFASTFVRSTVKPEQKRDASLWVGTSGAFELFVNGKVVLTDAAYRGHDVDRFGTSIELLPGYNDVTLKLCVDEQSPMLSLRLADAQGRPSPTLEATNDPKASEAARQLIKRLLSPPVSVGKDSTKPGTKRDAATASATSSSSTASERTATLPPDATNQPKTKHTTLGPIAEFEKAIADKNVSPDTLADYAEYLLLTDGDDPTTHKARDLSIQAAEKSGKLEHLLLAAALGEDKNQRTRWVEKAEALTQSTGTEDYRVLLVRAALERKGPNPSDAFVTYGKVLRIDPDNIEAVVQRAELYAAVGLPRTALETLDEALERNPASVRLLGAKAERLRELGRVTEAMETERRYANLRFDDGAWLGHMIDLSLARHDAKAAEFWVERVRAMSPHTPWALSLAARTYENVGAFDKAAVSYERALELSPEDTGVLRKYADLQGTLGKQREQLALLRRVVELMPQDKETRDYIEHLEPKRDASDERYAWSSEQYLPLRFAPSHGENRRTLRDLTVTTVFPNGLSSSFRQIVFQPMTDAAAAMSRQYAFQYESDRQIVQLRGAKVYRANGQIDEAVESGEGAANDPSMSMYTSARNFYVQFPRLDPKDVVELRYRVEDVVPRNEYADYFGDVAYLQSDEPVANAEYVLVTPKSRKLFFDTNLGSLVAHETTDTETQRIDRFFAKALPALDPEPKMPPFTELTGFVHASTFDSWKTMGHWYWGFIQDQFDLDEETRRLARRITENSKTDLDKVKAIYGWVVKNTRYVALEFGIYGYKPYRAVQTVARGWGDCKDKATAIVTLLRAVGIDSTIVILRTQIHGDFHSSIASLAVFDHAIAYVPSLDLYLDGTAEGTGIRELPIMDRGALALRVNNGQSELVRLPEQGKVPDAIQRNVVVQLEPNGSGTLELHATATGAVAPEWRNSYEAAATQRERVTVELGREFPGLQLLPGATGFSAEGLDDTEKDVSIDARGKAAELGRREGDSLSLTVTPSIRLLTTVGTLSERRHPLRLLGIPSYDDTFTVRLPPGFVKLSGPENAQGDSPFGSYSVEVEALAGKITVHTKLALKKTRIMPNEYSSFRQFCTEVDSAIGKRMVVGRP